MTDKEKIGELEGKLYVLEEFIKTMMVPHIPRASEEKIPREVVNFIGNMKTREKNFNESNLFPSRFQGLLKSAIFKGMRIGRDFLEGIFTE